MITKGNTLVSATPGVGMTWLMEDAIEDGAGLSLAKMTIDPRVVSEAHHHPNCTETIHVLSGSVLQRRGHEWIRLEAGDTVLIAVGAAHLTRNVGSETATMVVAYSTGSRVYVAETTKL